MQSVTVLATNGRRHVVKVEPNKTVLWVNSQKSASSLLCLHSPVSQLLQILEQTCEKHKLNVDEFDLKHHNKVLDLSLMFRFAGIPNNANLEMIPIVNKRVEQEVTICLQLDDGSRQNGQFASSTTLREILEKLCPEKLTGENAHLVVIYMRSEYHGDALNTTTLRIMGLSSGGRALLRLVHTDPTSLRVQANVSANLPQKPREPSPERPKSKVSQDKKIVSLNVADEIKKIKQTESSDEKKSAKEDQDVIADKIVESKSDSKAVDLSTDKKTQSEQEPEQMEVDTEPEPEPVINYLDDRGTIIFSLDSMKTNSSDVADSFFNLTESEIRLLYRELKQQVDEIENRPFMTSEMRKLEESKKILNQLAVYKTCIVRIQFPNRYVIQSKFSTVDKVEVVVEFVRKFLDKPDIEFHLCELLLGSEMYVFTES